MATVPMDDVSSVNAAGVSAAKVLVCLPSLTADGLKTMRSRLAEELAGLELVVASPDAFDANDGVKMVAMPAQSEGIGWALTSGDYAGAAQLADQYDAAVTVVLGAEAQSLTAAALRGLVDAVMNGKADVAAPRYKTGPHDALVSSALLYPLTRALFGPEVHLPLPLDVAFSARMAARLVVAARRTANGTQQAMLWPVAEAAVAGFVVHEVPAGERTLPHPTDGDLNSLLTEVAGSLFADIEVKAAFWQRARVATPVVSASGDRTDTDVEDVREMVEGFRNAFVNLQEIWSLVLPPQSLLALKKVSHAAAEEFEMPANLWARTVYDFVLAYHLRTINRGHLLGALTPLYLAWVASHLRKAAGSGEMGAKHVEETAAAFVAEKPYAVSRWRWPDRFNP